MSKDEITQQEIAAPEAASDVAEKAAGAAAAEPQEKETVRPAADKRKTSRYFTSRRIAQLAVFVAMALVMKLIGKSLTLAPTFTVTFIYRPWLISGAVLGPAGGMIVGAISDVLGNLVFGTPFIPLTFVSNTLYPAFIGLIYKFVPISSDYVKCVLGALCSLVFCTLGIGSAALYHWYGYYESMSFWQYLIAFRMPQVGVFAVNLVVLLALVKPLQHVGLFPKSEPQPMKMRVITFGVTAFVITAMAIVAIAILAAGDGDAPTKAPPIAMVCELYVALMALSAFIVTDKSEKFRYLLLVIGFAAAICAFALTATINSSIEFIAIKYVLSVLACVITAAVIAVAALRLYGKPRSKKI